MAEANASGFNARMWFAVMGPMSRPRPVVNILNERLVQLLSRPDVKDALARVAIKAESNTPEALAERVREDHAFFIRIVTIANVRAD
jgi:tripartite-type tricarboxylate transporter receptor subunit TctC